VARAAPKWNARSAVGHTAAHTTAAVNSIAAVLLWPPPPDPVCGYRDERSSAAAVGADYRGEMLTIGDVELDACAVEMALHGAH
jgi:hypothetical protein